tara:strand:- start:390 stop:566 length:177 start_codon:yes stop_codon:yes gene_type:complete
LVFLGGNVANHFGARRRKDVVNFLDCITEIIAVASGVSETKDCDGLVLEIKVLDVIKE